MAAVAPNARESIKPTPAHRDSASIRSNAAWGSSSGTVAIAGSGSSAKAATRSAEGATPSPINRIIDPASNRLTASWISLTGKTVRPSRRRRSKASCSSCGTRSTMTTIGAAAAAATQST
jgi:hypothetical protein